MNMLTAAIICYLAFTAWALYGAYNENNRE